MNSQEWFRKLKGAVTQGIITAEQYTRLETYLTAELPSSSVEAPRTFNPIMAVYYFGALLVLSAFGWFLGVQWEALGPLGILVVTGVYAGIFWMAARFLQTQEQVPVASGLLYTCVVGMVPLMTYAAEAITGVWPHENPGAYSGYYVWINGSWVIIEFATIAAAFLMLRKVRFSFLVMPAAIALWFLSMDIAELLYQHVLPWETRSWVSVVSGLVFLAAGWGLDRESRGEDYAFWVYLAGLLAFWGGLTSLPSHGELGKAVYFLINLGLIGTGLYLNRKTFAVFGVVGAFGYLGHLAWEVFQDSPIFPLVLATMGILMILAAVQFQKNYRRLQGWVRRPAQPAGER